MKKNINVGCEAYRTPSLRLIEIESDSIICQSDPSKWATDTDPEEDRL